MLKIDIFNHVFPTEYFELMNKVAGNFKDMGKRVRDIPMLMDVDERFRVMDIYGEDYRQILSLASPPLEVLAGPDKSPDLAKAANDGMARMVASHPDRFPGFVASLPINHRTTTVRGAMEALKPDIVRREQKRKGVKHRRYRRKTAAYVRQGEWFFLPRPMMHVGELAIHNGELVHNEGKPHRVEWLYRPEGRDETFVRGDVSHSDHETIQLQVWHRVVQNNEVEPTPVARPFTRMAYLD